jgi:predicted ATP-dependent Lon-type protease
MKLRYEREAFLKERLEQIEHFAPEDRERVGRWMEELLDRRLAELRRKIQDLEALRELFGLDRKKS